MNLLQLDAARDRQEAKRIAAVTATDDALRAEIRTLRLRAAVLTADLVMLRLRSSVARSACPARRGDQ
jgi:hypothetical protein